MGERNAATLEVGRVLDGKWVVLGFIGKGGMGEVYRAHQINLNRDVAIKIISPEWLASSDCATEEIASSVERFHREVQLMAHINHPNVLQIYDQGSTAISQEERELVVEYIAMEYVPGSTLRTTMSEEGFYPEEERLREWLATYFLPLLEGVQALHKAGIVHRDLKPENVLLAGRTPKIADFGLATSCLSKPITRSFHVMGTPQYMAQEQFLDLRRVDLCADVYSLGNILFEAIAGKIGPDLIPFKQAALKDAEGSFFQKLDTIIQKTTAEDKNHRLPSVEDFRRALLETMNAPEQLPLASPAAKAVAPAPSKATRKKWLWWLLGAMPVVAFLFFWLFYSHEVHRGAKPSSRPSSTALGLPTTVEGKDQVTLHLIRGGQIVLPKDFGPAEGRKVDVDSFYMDETPVTNQQYVEFLNQVLPTIQVKDGIVRSGGKIWLYLGEIKPGYRPILFNGRFHLDVAEHASCAVLRVTGYGAAAYARFYGERLPTIAQWFYAVKTGMPTGKENTALVASQKTLPLPTPVMSYKPNAYGVSGLNANIGEWGQKTSRGSVSATPNDAGYVVLGGLHQRTENREPVPGPIARYPWEAFEKVGFRCVRSSPPKNQ